MAGIIFSFKLPKFSCVEELSHQLVPGWLNDPDMPPLRSCKKWHDSGADRQQMQCWKMDIPQIWMLLGFCRDERWEDSGQILVSVTVTRFRTGSLSSFNRHWWSIQDLLTMESLELPKVSQPPLRGFDVYMLGVARPTNSPKIIDPGKFPKINF